MDEVLTVQRSGHGHGHGHGHGYGHGHGNGYGHGHGHGHRHGQGYPSNCKNRPLTTNVTVDWWDEHLTV